MQGYVRRAAVVAVGLTLAAVATAGVSADVRESANAADGAEYCKGHPITIQGTDEDDELIGTPGDDVLRAYRGDDVIDGRGGDDVLCGDAGADELIGGPGDDSLHGGPYRLFSEDGANAAEGDVLSGGPGDDRIFGGGRPTHESVHVPPANLVPDRVEFPEADGGITVTADGTVTGPGIGRDRLNDVQQIVGTRWADDITVRGRMIVSGMAGPDRIAVVGEDSGDARFYPTLFGGGGDDRLDLSGSATPGYWLYGGDGDDTIIGSRFDDFIGDRDGGGSVSGRRGTDRIDVTSHMSVRGGPDDDSMQIALESGPRGALDGGAGRDHAELHNGTSSPLTIDVPNRAIRLDGQSSMLSGTESFGASARAADVRFIGGPADETFGVVTWRDHTVRALMGAGDDYFAAYAPVDPDDQGTATAWGGPGDDVFDGSERGDSLFGEGGDDRMFGDSGDDLLRGGPGYDRGFGGLGEGDVCTAELTQLCEE